MTDGASSSPVWIDRVTFADGSEIPLTQGHTVIVVGPNNVGKSQTLKNLHEHLTGQGHPGYKVVTGIPTDHPGDTPQDLKTSVREWVTKHVPTYRNPSGGRYWGRRSATVSESDMASQLSRVPSKGLAVFGRLMTLYADASERLKLAEKSAPIDVARKAPGSPIQALYGDEAKIEAVSRACEEAFGSPITYDHIVDGTWRLRLGSLESMSVDRHGFPVVNHREEIRSMPSVDEQGDGLRSYVGLLTEMLSSTHVFVLLDEPEAFLHPPQARSLGRHIVELKAENSQLFVATHDANFLRGILDASATGAVTVVRLQRSGETTSASVLEAQNLRHLWNDPVLRYSNVLEGLFHHGVVVCEADPDCRLYESVVQAQSIADSGIDFMFTQGGGIDRIHKIVAALRAVDVPTRVITDADAIRDPNVVSRIVESLGGEWTSEMQDLRHRVAAVADSKRKDPDPNELRRRFEEVFGQVGEDDVLPEDAVRQLQDALSPISGWDEFKKYGLDSLKGDQHRFGMHLFDLVADCGLHLVPGGELESWFREAPGKGTSHVAHIHENSWHEDPERSRELIAFLSSVVGDFATLRGVPI